MFTPKSLTACPICKSYPLPQDEAKACPNCSADLTSYLEFYKRANQLYLEALDALSRHDFSAADELKQKMLITNPDFREEAIILTALSELYQHRAESAYNYALSIPSTHPSRKHLITEIEENYQRELLGKQHYNLALSSAREKYWADAKHHISQSLALIPYFPEVWRLAVKIAISSEDYKFAIRVVEDARKYVSYDSFIETVKVALMKKPKFRLPGRLSRQSKKLH